MSQFFGYIFRQNLWPSLFFTLLLSGVIWLSQGLRMLDVVVNRGQTAATFLELTIYVLPSLLTLVLPIAVFCAVLYALNRLYTDSEIVVMWSSGLSRWSIAAPIIALGLVFTAVGFLLNLYLMPLGYRAMKDKVYEIRADIATGLFREGSFTYPISGLTVFVREVTAEGELMGIFVHDSRPGPSQGTHMAESGRLVRTVRGPMLIMRRGTSIRPPADVAASPVFIQFTEQNFLPEQLSSPQGPTSREYTERYLPELLAPDLSKDWEKKNAGRLISEGHMRLATPLYNVALPMIAMAFLLCGSFSRRGFALRIITAVIIAILVRIAGVGVHSLVQDSLSLAFLHYLIPLGTILLAGAFLSGFDSARMIARLRTPPPSPAAA